MIVGAKVLKGRLGNFDNHAVVSKSCGRKNKKHPKMTDLGMQSPITTVEAMSSQRKRLTLPDLLESGAVAALLSSLREHVGDGAAVSLIASDVRKVSTLGLQVLVAAKAVSASGKPGVIIEDPSPEFCRACADTGLAGILGVKGGAN